MTAEETAEFIRLWEAGTEAAVIAARFGIPRSTVSSRAATLRQQGHALAKRPNGGAHPRRTALARASAEGADGTPARAPAPPPARHPRSPSWRSLKSPN